MKKIIFLLAIVFTMISCKKETPIVNNQTTNVIYQDEHHVVIEIGSWNMDQDSSVIVPLGELENYIDELSQIKHVEASIYTDYGVLYNLSDDGIIKTFLHFYLERTTDGVFDRSDFSSSSINRGYITVTYE